MEECMLTSPLTDSHRKAIAWALMRRVWQSFDLGGESMRSQRSVALELAMDLVRDEAAIDAASRAYDTDPDAFIELARSCRSCDQSLRMIEADIREGLNPFEGVVDSAKRGIEDQERMVALLIQYGFPLNA
jgi:hypothetical protein